MKIFSKKPVQLFAKNKLGRVALLALVLAGSLQSCIIITDNNGGTHGRDGKAYFGIDYDWNPPYAYWDDNPSVPDNPFFGENYRSQRGVYDFEYFVNQYEYWWGTYEIFINHGLPGGPNGEDGINGNDSFLMLICNDDGFYFENWEEYGGFRTLEDGTQIIEFDRDGQKVRITMQKADVRTRPTHNEPKYKAE